MHLLTYLLYVVATLLGLTDLFFYLNPIVFGFVVLGLIATVIWLLYYAPKHEKQTTYVPTGEVKFVEQGGACFKVLPNLTGTGWHYDYKKREIVPGEKSLLYPPFNFLGVYWVSLLYPMRKIHPYHFEWDKLKKGDVSKGEESHYVEPRSEYVNSIYLFYAYPIFVEEVELKGNIKINIMILVTLRLAKPELPVFVFKGKWFPLASAPIKGAVIDYASKLTLDEFRDTPKQGVGTELSKAIMRINEVGDEEHGISRFGFAVDQVDFIYFDLVGSEEVKVAATATEVARLEADADAQRARGITTIGQAHANALKAQLDVATEHPGGIDVLQQQIIAGGIRDFTGGVLSIGGQPSMAVDLNSVTRKTKTKKEVTYET